MGQEQDRPWGACFLRATPFCRSACFFARASARPADARVATTTGAGRRRGVGELAEDGMVVDAGLGVSSGVGAGVVS